MFQLVVSHASVVACVLFAGRGVVDLRLFGNRNYGAMAASSALGNLVMYTTLIAIPLYLRDIEANVIVDYVPNVIP